MTVTLTTFEEMTGIAAPGLSPAGGGRIYFDSGDLAYKVSQNGGAYANLVGGGGVTLDGAYDFGGAGAGRIITADAGAVEVQGAGGLKVAAITIDGNSATRAITTDAALNVTSAGAMRFDSGGANDYTFLQRTARFLAEPRISRFNSNPSGTSVGLIHLNALDAGIPRVGVLRVTSPGGGASFSIYESDATGDDPAPASTSTVIIGKETYTATVYASVLRIQGASAATERILNITVSGTTATFGTTGAGVGPVTSMFFDIEDNQATPFTIRQRTANLNYLEVVTTDGAEEVKLGNATTNPSYSLLGVGVTTASGPVRTTTSATLAAIRVGSFAGDPSTLANGDTWYNSTTNKFRARENGASVDMIGGGVSGSGAATQVAHWSGASSLTGTAGFTFDSANLRLTVSIVTLGANATPTTGDVWFATPFLNYRDAGGTKEVVNAESTQTISGQKNFSEAPIFSDDPGAQFQTQINFTNYGSPTAGGNLARNGPALEYHTGAFVETLLGSGSAVTITGIYTFSTAPIFADGVKVTFNPDATNAGINVGQQAGDPSTLINGDIWYNSSAFRARENGVSVTFMNLEAAQTITGIKTISAAFSYTDGVKQTFNPDATNAGMNFGGHAGAPSALVSGDAWYHETRQAIAAFSSGVQQLLSGAIFSQDAQAIVTATAVETTIFGAGSGTLTLPANFFSPGKIVRIRISGRLSSAGSETLDIKTKLGVITVGDTLATVLSIGALTNRDWELVYEMVCHTTGVAGNVGCGGYFRFLALAGSSGVLTNWEIGLTSTRVIDTTIANILDVTVQWGSASASNTITSVISSVEVIR